jgi:cob(I)alamin adenosyltransferase
MVKLNRIYTRGGDKGETSLGSGERRRKSDPRIKACGSIDEANAAIGLARLYTQDDEADPMLARIQNDLFDLGADLSVPEQKIKPRAKGESAAKRRSRLRMNDAHVKRLEAEIDAMNAELSPLTSFVLPGGKPGSAALHLARTIVRRAERDIVALGEKEKINPAALRYVNRLSDHFFVLARRLNDRGLSDVLWVPGANLPREARSGGRRASDKRSRENR